MSHMVRSMLFVRSGMLQSQNAKRPAGWWHSGPIRGGHHVLTRVRSSLSNARRSDAFLEQPIAMMCFGSRPAWPKPAGTPNKKMERLVPSLLAGTELAAVPERC